MAGSGRRTIALCLLLALVASGCSGTDDPGERSADDPTEEAGATTGDATAEEDSTSGDSDAEGEGDATAVADAEPAEPGSWTYMVYSLADTDLEEYMLTDVLEMAEVGSSESLDVVAMVDRAEGYTDGSVANLEDWESAKLLQVMPGELVELEDLGEVDMGDPSQLAAFIEYGITNFPADNYALNISDHGGGWTGIGPDDSSGEVLDLAELAAALEEGLGAAGVDRLDMLGFDACLMATYEVASAMAPYATHMLASEELEPGHGWDYRSLAGAAAGPTDVVTLGTAFVDGFAGQAEEWGTGAEITLSLIDLTQLPALDEAMAAFAGELGAQVDALGPLIGQQRESGIDYARSPDPSAAPQLTDLGVFVSEIGVASLQVADPADGVLRAINDVVLAQTVGPARLGSTGLSIYFPATADLFNPAYAQTTDVVPWLQFLEAYHGAGAAIPPEEQPAVVDAPAPPPPAQDEPVTIDGGEALVEEVEGGVDVSIQLDPTTLENVVSASLSFGYVDPEDGSIVQLGDTEAEVLEDGTVGGFTDLTVLTITDEVGDTIDAYLSLEFDEEEGVAYASVPLDYTDPETGETSPVNLSIVLDPETGDVLQEVYYLLDEESGAYGELVADPEGLVSPVVLVYGADGSVEWVPYGDTALYADLPSLAYGLELLEPGTEIYVDIVVTDFGGNELIAAATFLQG